MKGNVHFPKTLIWDQITLLDDQLLKKAVYVPRQLPNTVESITTHPEGDVEFKFNRSHAS